MEGTTNESGDDGDEDVLVLKFEADWCGPCSQQQEILQGQYTETEEVRIQRVDIEEEQEKASAFNVRSLPTIVVTETDSESPQKVFTGITEFEEIDEAVSEVL